MQLPGYMIAPGARRRPAYMQRRGQGASPGGGDPYWANVALLIHADGADGSTSFTDLSDYGHTLIAQGNAQVDTAQSKFGGGSLLLDGIGDYLSVPTAENGAELRVSNAVDKTFEAWVRLADLGHIHGVFSHRDGGVTRECAFYVSATNVLQFVTFKPTDTVDVNVAGVTALTTGRWYHVAATREAGLWRVFLDGVLEGSQAETVVPGSWPSNDFLVGYYGTGADRYLTGWLDEMRITHGVARYTAAFTPPDAPFPAG